MNVLTSNPVGPVGAPPPPVTRAKQLQANASESAKFSGYALHLRHGSALVLAPPPLRSVQVAHEPGEPKVRALENPAARTPPRPESLGSLDDGLAQVLRDVIEQHPSSHSTRGDKPLPPENWTKEQLGEFLRTGKVPMDAPNSVDFIKTVFERFANHLGSADAEGRKRFLVALAAVTTPQELQDLVPSHFAPGAEGIMRFYPLPFAPPPGKDLVNSPSYYRFMEVAVRSGMTPQSFETLVENLSARAPFFAKVFSDPAHLRWGETFFSQLGAKLATCAPGEAAAVVMYHPDCYNAKEDKSGNKQKGTGVTHVSVLAVTPEGEACVSHHESVTIAKPAAAQPVRNLMTGSLGLPTDTYDTAQLHDWVASKSGYPKPPELPIDLSFRLHGGPSGMVTKVKSFNRFQAYTEQQANRSRREEGLSLLYAADPDHVARRVVQRHRAGEAEVVDVKALGERFPKQPLVPPPGGIVPEHVPDYSNNCLLSSALVLLHAGCEAFPPGTKASASNTLAELLTLMDKGRLVPDTDSQLAKKVREQWKDESDINVRSLQLLAKSWSMQPGEGYPADMPRDATYLAYQQVAAVAAVSPAAVVVEAPMQSKL